MLALDNRTPYAAERAFMRDKLGADHWIVAIKATFRIEPSGKVKLDDEQLSPTLATEYWGEPGASSVKYESDLSLLKPATDILVNGSACAPQERPTDRVTVRVRVHTFEKTLLVMGPRVFYQGPVGLTTTAPKRFAKLPLRYELAYGGTDTTSPDPGRHRMDARNPVGLGFAVNSTNLENKPAPSIVYDDGNPAGRGPAGYGPLASYWSPRRELGGTYDDRWDKLQRPLLPTDWQEETLLAAPTDQRVAGYLRGGEPVELVNLTPGGILRFELPTIFLGFTTHFGTQTEEHRGRLVTVILEPDDARLTMVWQSSLKVPLRRMDYLDRTVILQKRHL